jgi:hypothetical protein
MKHLYYFLYKKIFHIPCRAEVKEAYNMPNLKVSARIRRVAERYAEGGKIHIIAWADNITVERVRQMLFKIVRVASGKYD